MTSRCVVAPLSFVGHLGPRVSFSSLDLSVTDLRAGLPLEQIPAVVFFLQATRRFPKSPLVACAVARLLVARWALWPEPSLHLPPGGPPAPLQAPLAPHSCAAQHCDSSIRRSSDRAGSPPPAALAVR